MIPWKERLKFRSCNPAKIIKYDVLVRVICATITGYIENIEIYRRRVERLKGTILSLLELYLDQVPRLPR